MSAQDTIAPSPGRTLSALSWRTRAPFFVTGCANCSRLSRGSRLSAKPATLPPSWGLSKPSSADLLLLEFSQSAFDTLEAMAAAGSSTRTIILAETVDGANLTKALELGARGLVLKDSAADVLFKCIHSVVAGRYWIASDAVPDPRGVAQTRRRASAPASLRVDAS